MGKSLLHINTSFNKIHQFSKMLQSFIADNFDKNILMNRIIVIRKQEWMKMNEIWISNEMLKKIKFENDGAYT